MKRRIFIWLSLLTLIIGVAASADSFTGPNRSVSTTYTTNQRQVCYWEAQHPDLPSGPRCFLKLYTAPSDGCPTLNPISDQGYFSGTACAEAWSGLSCPASGGRDCSIGWQNNWVENCTPGQPGCTAIQHVQTTTYPPATVSGVTSCTLSGKNDWCIGEGQLSLSANEPLSGYSITGIDGSTGPLCTGSSCSWTFPEGNTTLSYWATSSYGDTSVQASSSMKIDTIPPVISINTPVGKSGNNDWYVSSVVNLTASATDETSGIAGIWSSLDGGPWQSGASLAVTGEGGHKVDFRTQDIAGHEADQTTSMRIDSQAPELVFSIPDPDGENGWYISPVTLSASAMDATSGVESEELSTDGLAWSESLTLADGDFEVQGRAVDNAGNETLESKTIRIDTKAPAVDLSTEPEPEVNGWFTSPVNVEIHASDETSGIGTVKISMDGGSWQDATSLVVPDGIHALQIQAMDQAGNQTSQTNTYKVDSVPPQSSFTNPAEGSTTDVSGTVTFQGESKDETSGVGGAEISTDNGLTWNPLTIRNDGNWTYSWNSNNVPNGTYMIQARSSDVAGNEDQTASVTVTVSNNPPVVDIPDSWKIWETVPVKIQSTGAAIQGARLTITNLQNLSQERVLVYDSAALPRTFKWDQRLDNHKIAPPGKYQVILEAWDSYGNTGRDEGIITIPSLLTRTTLPTLTMVPTVTPTPLVVSSEAVSSNRTFKTSIPMSVGTIILKPTPLPKPQQQKTVLFWPSIGLIGFLATLASAGLSDPRARALQKLRKTLEMIRKNNLHLE
jgi:Bacterial Ig domain/Bacterial Ig-like domain (group 3)